MVLKFDGVNDYVNCGDDPLFWSRALTKFSFSFWVYITSPPDANSRWVINHGGTSNQSFRCIYETDGKLNFVIKDSVGSNHIAVTDTAVTLNKWIFVTCVYDNSLVSDNLKIYLDSVLQVDKDNLTETINLSAELRLSDSSNDLQGYMKDFRFWKTEARSSTQVTQLYEGRDETDFPPDYWLPMDEGTGNPKSWGLRAILKNGTRWASDNKSIFLDGTEGYVDCGVEPTLWSKSLTNFSVSLWIRGSVLYDILYRNIFNINDGTNDVILTLQQPNKIAVAVTKDNYTTSASAESLIVTEKDRWYHVAVTYDSAVGIKLYVDSILGTTGSYNFTLTFSSTANMLLGRYIINAIGSGHFSGNIKLFKFWNTNTLNSNQIRYLFDGTGSVPPVATYELDFDHFSGDALDSISDPKTGTLNGAVWAWRDSTLLTSDPSYNEKVGYKIVIKSNDEMKTYFRYDTFGSKPFKVNGLRSTLADSETDLSLLAIEDSNDTLDDTKLTGGCKYFVSLTTGETVPYEDLFAGYGELLEAGVEATNKIIKFISIFGTKILATYRYLNYNRAAKLNELQSPTSVKGVEFESWFHVDRAITKSSELLYDKMIIRNTAHWDDIDLHKEINTIISGISLGTISLWDFMEYQKSITGGTWGTDFKNKKERYFYQYPELTQTNIVLKSGYEKSPTDKANQVAWVFPPFQYIKDTTTDVNHSTLLHGITQTSDAFIAGSSEAKGNTNLTYRAIAQSLPLPADAKRIKTINLMLSMKGDVSSPENKVNGKLCLSDANGKPLGTSLDKFSIPLSDIDDSPSVVSVSVDVDPDDIKGDSKVWIILYQRSGTDETDKGDPNHDESKTILWHHNNILNVAGQYASATATEGDRHKEPLQWLVKETGPQYACSITSDIQRMNTIMTPQLFPRYGVKEHIINVSELTDRATVNSYMQYKAFLLSQERRYIPTIKAKIVNNLFYRPNQTILVTIAKPKISAIMRIQRVTYDIRPINEQTGENNSSRLVTLSLVEINNPANQVKFNCDY